MKSPVDYSEMTRSNRSRRTVLSRGQDNTRSHREYLLTHHTAGYECAGSMARWTREVWSVSNTTGGVTYGQRYITEAGARQRFDALTKGPYCACSECACFRAQHPATTRAIDSVLSADSPH